MMKEIEVAITFLSVPREFMSRFGLFMAFFVLFESFLSLFCVPFSTLVSVIFSVWSVFLLFQIWPISYPILSHIWSFFWFERSEVDLEIHIRTFASDEKEMKGSCYHFSDGESQGSSKSLFHSFSIFYWVCSSRSESDKPPLHWWSNIDMLNHRFAQLLWW